jgi:hypothetical protein
MRADENHDNNDHTGTGASHGLDHGGRLPDGERRASEEGARVEAAPPDLCRVRQATSRPECLQLRGLARAALLRQQRSDTLRGLSERAFLLVVFGNAFEDDDRVPLRRAVLQTENGQPPHRCVRVARRQVVEQRPVGVDRGRPVAREQLQREQCGAARRRALVLEPTAEQLELLPVAELSDRPVRDRPLAEIAASRRALELVVPARPECRELGLGAGRSQLVGLRCR